MKARFAVSIRLDGNRERITASGRLPAPASSQPSARRNSPVVFRSPVAVRAVKSKKSICLEPELLKEITSDGGVTVSVTRLPGAAAGSPPDLEVAVVFDPPRPGAILHWAVDDWTRPPESSWPADTPPAGAEGAVETAVADGGSRLAVRFPDEDGCPGRVVAVVRMPDDKWDNNGGQGYSALLRAPSTDSTVSEILKAESGDGAWGLFPRVSLANEKLDMLAAGGFSGMTFLLTWLRLSNIRQLTWYRGYNYQSKDMDHAQKQLAERLAALVVDGKADSCVRRLARSVLAGLPRGGGDAEAIRMGILHIMRDGGIKEGHRPGEQKRRRRGLRLPPLRP